MTEDQKKEITELAIILDDKRSAFVFYNNSQQDGIHFPDYCIADIELQEARQNFEAAKNRILHGNSCAGFAAQGVAISGMENYMLRQQGSVKNQMDEKSHVMRQQMDNLPSDSKKWDLS